MRFRRIAPAAGPTVEMQLLNPATNAPSVQLSTPAELKVTLINRTGAGIAIESGASAAGLQIFMPDEYFSVDQIEAMSIDLADWTFTYIDALSALNLTYTGANRTWADGTAIEFTIHNVLSTGDTGSGDVLINPTNIEGQDVPPQFQAQLDILPGFPDEKPRLSDVLRASLENQGIVYVSASASDPLTNALILNLKNTGTTPIYMGKEHWKVAPAIEVSFDYGSNPGDLAPAIDPSQPPVGSAWRIKGVPAGKQGGSWVIDGPGSDTPLWRLSPSNTNVEVLGARSSANVSFGFEQIVSITQAGHTQMHLKCSNFYRDDNTPYEQGVLPPLDILKLDAPPTRGLLSIYSRNGVLFNSTGSSSDTSVELAWTMFYVAKVNIISSYPGAEVITRLYPNAPPLNPDTFSAKIPASRNSMPVVLTLQAFDARGGYLNSLQLTVSITSNNFVDSRDGKVYPIVQVGNKYWMSHNLDYDDHDPEHWNDYYDRASGNGPRYGRLYSASVATEVPSGSWRLPSRDDWESLFDSFKSPYEALIDQGKSAFDAQLGGTFQADSRGNGGKFVGMSEKGYYWTSTFDEGQLGYALFDASDKSVSAHNTTLLKDGCSVRYVKDI
jgi:uncharacterized protein (TIGR02145 family)